MKDREPSEARSVLKSITALQQFKLTPQEAAPIYHDAVQLPHFLTTSLRSEYRKVKEFSGDDAIIRAFYFNLMKLAFQLENEEVNYCALVREILTGEGEFGIGELEDKNFSDHQYRQFLKEFMDLLELQEISNFEETITFYPVIDEILLKMFKQLVPVTLLIRDDSDEKIAHRVFSFLSSKFKIRLELVGSCFKFVESDIFVYASSLKLIFLIFDDHLAYIKEVTEDPSSSIISSGHSERVDKDNNHSKKSILSGQSVNEVKGKDFQTVINILNSNKTVVSKDNKQRNSFNSELTKSRNKIDSIKESRENNMDYGDPPSFSQHSQKDDALFRASISSQLSSISHTTKDQQCVSKNSHFDHNSRNSSQFACLSPKTTEVRSVSKICPEGVKVYSTKTYGGVGHARQQEYSKFSSQIYTQGKPSNLGIFSSIEGKKRKVEIKENITDDSGYERFTNSKILEFLDEEYRQEIKMIKKKYRAQRANIRNYL